MASAIVWADHMNIVVIPDYNALNDITTWSHVANELLYVDCENGQNKLIKASMPDFQPQVLSEQSACTSALWSLDGQSIAYIGSSEDIWVVNRDGNDNHLVYDVIAPRFPWLAGWTNEQTLLHTNYSGGGHVTFELLDVQSGDNRSIATVPGGSETSNAEYVPIVYETDPQLFNLMVISEKLPISTEEIPAYFAEGRYSHIPEFDSVPIDQSTARFISWRPGTNQMLVAWKSYTPYPDWVIQKENLLLWDVKTGDISLLVPNSYEGQFSPDGQYLVYLSHGQAKFDPNGVPVDWDNGYHPELYPSELQPIITYLQLLEMDSRQVKISIPANAMNFSPDNRYLSFTTFGKVETDSANRPIGIAPGTEQTQCTNFVDLSSGTFKFSLDNVSTYPVWAPNGMRFAYLDSTGNLNLYDMDDHGLVSITKKLIGFNIRGLNWSFDGQYLMVKLVTEQDQKYSYYFAILRSP
jgi:Tol biopolymer transport system component